MEAPTRMRSSLMVCILIWIFLASSIAAQSAGTRTGSNRHESCKYESDERKLLVDAREQMVQRAGNVGTIDSCTLFLEDRNSRPRLTPELEAKRDRDDPLDLLAFVEESVETLDDFLADVAISFKQDHLTDFETSEHNYEIAAELFTVLKDCPTVLQRARSFTLELSAACRDYEIHGLPARDCKKWESAQPINEIGHLLVDVLQGMPRLEHFKLDLGNWQSRSKAYNFSKIAHDRALVLPGLKSFESADEAKLFVPFMPDLERLHTHCDDENEWLRAYPSPGKKPRLTLLDALPNPEKLLDLKTWGPWNAALARAVSERCPRLRNLTVPGLTFAKSLMVEPECKDGDEGVGCVKPFRKWDNYVDEDPWGTKEETWGTSLIRLFEGLSSLSHLEYLALTAPADTLGLGVEEGPMCGNAFFGVEGEAYGRRLDAQWTWAPEFVTLQVMREIPQLQRFWFQGHERDVNRRFIGPIGIFISPRRRDWPDLWVPEFSVANEYDHYHYNYDGKWDEENDGTRPRWVKHKSEMSLFDWMKEVVTAGLWYWKRPFNKLVSDVLRGRNTRP